MQDTCFSPARNLYHLLVYVRKLWWLSDFIITILVFHPCSTTQATVVTQRNRAVAWHGAPMCQILAHSNMDFSFVAYGRPVLPKNPSFDYFLAWDHAQPHKQLP
jgi:hypothetical protein